MKAFLIIIGENSTNIFNSFELMLNYLKKKVKIFKILDIYGRVRIETCLYKLCEQILYLKVIQWLQKSVQLTV